MDKKYVSYEKKIALGEKEGTYLTVEVYTNDTISLHCGGSFASLEMNHLSREKIRELANLLLEIAELES